MITAIRVKLRRAPVVLALGLLIVAAQALVPISEPTVYASKENQDIWEFVGMLAVMSLVVAIALEPSPAEKYLEANPGVDDRTRQAVLNGDIFIGMDAAAARASWGKPHRINRTVGPGYEREQWVYDRHDYKRDYVYVVNGVVVSWQTSD